MVPQPNGVLAPTLRQVFYTGLTRNATKGSRTAIAEDIRAGYVVTFDDYGHDKGFGVDVTKPVTALLDRFAGIVFAVPKGSERGGFVTIATGAAAIKAWTNADMSSAFTTRVNLGPANGSWALTAITPDFTSAAAGVNTMLRIVALAGEQVNTSSTAGMATVSLNVGGSPRT